MGTNLAGSGTHRENQKQTSTNIVHEPIRVIVTRKRVHIVLTDMIITAKLYVYIYIYMSICIEPNMHVQYIHIYIHRLLPTAYGILPNANAYCMLPNAYCLLPVEYGLGHCDCCSSREHTCMPGGCVAAMT